MSTEQHGAGQIPPGVPGFAGRAVSDVITLPRRDGGEVDLEKTLTSLLKLAASHDKATKQQEASSRSDLFANADGYERRIVRAQKWGGWVWGLISISVAIFTAGMGYAVFAGENALDSEVQDAVHKEAARHNGGVHPEVIDPASQEPVGDHPDIREQVGEVKEHVGELKVQATRMEATQKKLDKRSEYQFELGRWETRVMEAKRKRVKAPSKPDALDKLETDLMLGKYE